MAGNRVNNYQQASYIRGGNLWPFMPPPIIAQGPPSTYNIAVIGSIWIDNRVGVNNPWILCGIFQGNGIWKMFGGGGGAGILQITTNSGVANPIGGNVNLFNANTNVIWAAVGATMTQDFALTSNLALGDSLAFLAGGTKNVSTGQGAMHALVSGVSNSFYGFNSGAAVNSGGGNVGLGAFAMNGVNIGSNNLVLGTNSGSAYTGAESSNILLSNAGVIGESNIMRLGTTGAGSSQVNKAFMAGTYGITPGSSGIQMVVMDSTGQLGTSPTGGNVLSWVNVTAASQAMAPNTGYVDSHGGGLCTMTLPAVIAFGQIIRVVGSQAGNSWLIAQRAGQSIAYENQVTTVGVAGSLASTNINDTVELLCTVANTGFTVISGIGNIVVT